MCTNDLHNNVFITICLWISELKIPLTPSLIYSKGSNKGCRKIVRSRKEKTRKILLKPFILNWNLRFWWLVLQLELPLTSTFEIAYDHYWSDKSSRYERNVHSPAHLPRQEKNNNPKHLRMKLHVLEKIHTMWKRHLNYFFQYYYTQTFKQFASWVGITSYIVA